MQESSEGETEEGGMDKVSIEGRERDYIEMPSPLPLSPALSLSTPLSYALDKWGPVRVSILGTLMISLGYVGMSFCPPHLWSLMLLCFVVVSFGSGTASFVLLSHLSPYYYFYSILPLSSSSRSSSCSSLPSLLSPHPSGLA